MRKLILVAVTLLCSGLWAFAQTSSSSSTSPSSTTAGQSSSTSGMGSSSSTTGTGNNTIEGCLSGSAGNYTLRDKATGTTYNLTGSDSEIASHVGQEVRVKGSESNSSEASSTGTTSSPSSSSSMNNGSSSAMSNGAGSSSANHSFTVSSVSKVSSSCSNQ